MKAKNLALLVLAAALAAPLSPQTPATPSVRDILTSFVKDFRSDPAAATARTFGIVVKGASEPEWTVAVSGTKGADGLYGVELRPGLPKEPTVLYTADEEILGRVDRGEINALTAMGKARQSDAAPMDIDAMPGFQPGPEFVADILPLTFHFWTRGIPEVVDFKPSAGRTVHGANMIVFYYQPGLRSAWGEVRKGMRVNADPKDQVNPFPTLFIAIKGKAVMKVGGVEKTFSAGQTIFVPAGVAHEAWNPYDEPAEVIMISFGDGA